MENLKMNSRQPKDIQCTFIVHGHEYAIGLDYVQEVVSWPSEINRVEQTEDYFLGVFYLREILVPVVDLALFLNPAQNIFDGPRRIAILKIEDNCLGIAVDQTSEVQSFSNYTKSYFKKDDYFFISGAIKSKESSKAIQIIDPVRLVSILKVPHIPLAQDNSRLGGVALKNSRALLAKVGDSQFAIRIEAVQEVIESSGLKQENTQSDVCLGVVHSRGYRVPILDSYKVFGIRNQANQGEKHQRILILKQNSSFVGISVDHVDRIFLFNDSNRVTYSDPGLKKVPFLEDCIQMEGSNQVFLIDYERLFEHESVRYLIEIYKSASQAQTELPREIRTRS